jgi:hypothetical protein
MMSRFLAAFGTVLLAMSLAHGADAGRTPKPHIVIEKGDKCVAPTEVMRREHMNMLKHHRDETVHQGIRTTQYSLKGCVDCHASRKTGSVLGSRENFCQSCHEYAAVKLDCFECHSTKPQPAAAQAQLLPGKQAASESRP